MNFEFVDPIKLDPHCDGVPFEPEDWMHCQKTFGLMHHLPTGNDYMVVLPDEARQKALVSLLEFEATLVKVGVGGSFLEEKEVVEHARAAIAVFLIETGLWNPTIVEIPEKPKPCRKRTKQSKLSR